MMGWDFWLSRYQPCKMLLNFRTLGMGNPLGTNVFNVIKNYKYFKVVFSFPYFPESGPIDANLKVDL